jgi:hypothetical protein
MTLCPVSLAQSQLYERPRARSPTKSRTQCKACGIDPASSPLWPLSHSLRYDSSYSQDLRDEYRGYIVYRRWMQRDKTKQKLRRERQKAERQFEKEKEKAEHKKEKLEHRLEKAATKRDSLIGKARQEAEKTCQRRQKKEEKRRERYSKDSEKPERTKQEATPATQSATSGISTPLTSVSPNPVSEDDRISQGPDT